MVQLVSDCTTICLIFTFQIPFLSFSIHISRSFCQFLISSWNTFLKSGVGNLKIQYLEFCCLCTVPKTFLSALILFCLLWQYLISGFFFLDQGIMQSFVYHTVIYCMSFLSFILTCNNTQAFMWASKLLAWQRR